MKVNILSKVITLLSASLFTAGANAATSYFSEGHLSLEVISFTDKFGISFDIDDQASEIDFSFLLEAGETENAFASIYSYGESESISAVSSVPLPQQFS